MEISEDIKEARDILQNIIKAKKNLRMYPENNPIYVKTLQDSYSRFKDFFEYRDSLTLKIKQNSIYFDSEQLYYNPEKEDNLALFFFKDGLREIIFNKGLLQNELEEFLKIVALDFDRETVDDDVVTLLWEKDFQNIQYVVEEGFLVDLDIEEFEKQVEEKVAEKVTDVDDLMKAYADGFIGEDVNSISIVPLADKDLQTLVKELEKDATDKIEKLVTIIFELIYQAEDRSDIEDSFTFLKDAIKYTVAHGELSVLLNVMKKNQEVLQDPTINENDKKYLKILPQYIGTEEIVSLLAEILDGSIEVDEKDFEELSGFLDKNAIDPLIKYLGELKTIRGRRFVIDALSIIGKKDIKALARGLDDERWYVIRNIIYILRKIGDKRAVEYLLKTIRHGDVRVRKEVIKTLGELGGREVVQTLRESLSDPDMQVRIASAKAFAAIGSETAKKILFDYIIDKTFKEKEFEEKKEMFEVLSRWKDDEVFEFLVKILKAKSFFGRAKINENKACAALCLGLLGNKDALPMLNKLADSNNALLREFAYTAIKRLEYGK
jgi:HEAT repeat protein